MTRRNWTPFLAIALVAGLAAGQATDRDYIVCENDTNTGSTVHGVYVINRTSGVVLTLFTVPPSTTIMPNWLHMARDNGRILVGYGAASAYGLTYLNADGTISASYATTYRIDNTRVRDNGQLVHNGIGGTPSITYTCAATDDLGAGLAILVAGLPTTATPLNCVEIEDSGNWAVSAQGTSPAGYLSIVNLAAGTILTTYSGFGLFNTVDFNKHDGFIYGTEFGLPGNTGAANGTLWRISQTGTMTSILQGVDRQNCIEVQQDGNLAIGSRHNVLEVTTGGVVLRTLPFQAERLHAATGLTIYGGNRLQLDTSGGTAPGNTIEMKVAVRGAAFAGGSYIMAPTLSIRPGVTLPGGDILDINIGDPLFFAYFIFGLGNGTVFNNLTGVLDANGESPTGATRPRIVIPADFPPGSGVRMFVGGVAVGSGGALAAIETEGFTLN